MQDDNLIKKPLERLTIAVDDQLTVDGTYSNENCTTDGLAKINNYDSILSNIQISPKIRSTGCPN